MRETDYAGGCKIPFSSSCVVCFPHCLSQDTFFFASLFGPDLWVPPKWVAATVSSHKEFLVIGGTAGRKQRLLIEERACNKQTIDSKVKYLNIASTHWHGSIGGANTLSL